MSWCWKYGGKNGNGDKLSILQHKGNAKKISVGANIPIAWWPKGCLHQMRPKPFVVKGMILSHG